MQSLLAVLVSTTSYCLFESFTTKGQMLSPGTDAIPNESSSRTHENRGFESPGYIHEHAETQLLFNEQQAMLPEHPESFRDPTMRTAGLLHQERHTLPNT